MSKSEQELRVELEELDAGRQTIEEELNRERLVRITGDMIRVITAPKFIERMRQARIAADEGGGLDVGAQLLSIDGLRQAGVDIPADFRLTSRVFEDKAQVSRFEIKSDAADKPSPRLGCCSGSGSFGFCGCAGFGV